MKFAKVCGFELWVDDGTAEWDAVAEDSPWEKVRFDSMLSILRHGDVLYDIGAERGWISAIYAQTVGGGNMVLVEPSSDFWPNIRGCWESNELDLPLATVEAFCGVNVIRPPSPPKSWIRTWPKSSVGRETATMDYRHPNDHSETIGTITIDWLNSMTGKPPKGITIDVEGAELGVLQGAKVTLHNERPNVWVSIHPDLMLKDFGTLPDEIFTFMTEAGYSMKLLGIDHEQHWMFWPAEWGPR